MASSPFQCRDNLRVVICNLPPTSTIPSIRKLLSTRTSAFQILDLSPDESSLMMCTIELENYRAAKRVLSLNGTMYQRYQISAELYDESDYDCFSSPTQENASDSLYALEVFVKRLSYETTENALWDLFSQFGPVEQVTLPRWYDSGKPRGFAFVRFGTEEAHQKAVASDGQISFLGSMLMIRPNFGRAGKTQAMKPKPVVSKRLHERPEGCTTIYVGNINFAVTEAQLYDVFSDCGTIENVRIVRQQYTNRSRGFAYVEFADEESVSEAVKKNGMEFCDRLLRVDFAEPYDPDRNKSKNFTSFSPTSQTNLKEGDDHTPNGNPNDICDSDPKKVDANKNRNPQQNQCFVPTPQGFIVNHFMKNPIAGMAAFAGSMQNHNGPMNPYGFQMPFGLQQPAPQPPQPFAPSFLPAMEQLPPPTPLPNTPLPSAPLSSCFPTSSPPLTRAPSPSQHFVPQLSRFFPATATQTVYNVNPDDSGDKFQIEATFFTQGIPGLGQFIAPYAYVTQRKLAEVGGGAVSGDSGSSSPEDKSQDGSNDTPPIGQSDRVQKTDSMQPMARPVPVPRPTTGVAPLSTNSSSVQLLPGRTLPTTMRRCFSADEERALKAGSSYGVSNNSAFNTRQNGTLNNGATCWNQSWPLPSSSPSHEMSQYSFSADDSGWSCHDDGSDNEDESFFSAQLECTRSSSITE